MVLPPVIRAVVRVSRTHRVEQIHFSKCNNNQLFNVGKTFSKERDFLITKPTIQWTSKTKQTRRRAPTRRRQIHDIVVDPQINKRTSIPITSRIRFSQNNRILHCIIINSEVTSLLLYRTAVTKSIKSIII